MSHSRGSRLAIPGAILLALAFAAASASATLITTKRMLKVTEVDPEITAIHVGDRFIINFVLNDAATDIQPSTATGIFPGLVTSFSMNRHPSSTGTWVPSGTFDLGAEATYATSADLDAMVFTIPGTGFPNGGADLLFENLDLVWDWPPGISDSGSGQTFAQQLLPNVFRVPPAVFLGNGIAFEYAIDPGVAYLATTIDVTIFVDGFESNSYIMWSEIHP